MYTPKFTYTDRLVQNLVKLENSRTVLQEVDLSYEVKYKLSQHAKALNLLEISNMLNVKMGIKDAERITDGAKALEEFDNDKNKILMNIKKVQDFIRSSNAENYPEFEKSIIIEINRFTLNQWRETWEAEYRNFNDTIDERWDSLVKYRDTSIIGQEVEGFMDELIEWYKYSIPTMTALVRIAIVFYRLLEIAPFIAGNKFTILVIIDYLLYKNGYSSKIFASTLRTLRLEDDRVERMIQVVRQTDDLSLWIDTFVKFVNDELLHVREEINTFIIEDEKSKAQPFLDLNKRQLKVLKYLQTVPVIKREEYCHMMDVSTMTAFRDLNDLVRKKLLKIDGRGRGTKYRLVST